MAQVKDRTGQVVGRLIVLRLLPIRASSGHARWECECVCGNKTVVNSDFLSSGRTRSCGCYQRECAAAMGKQSPSWLTTHGCAVRGHSTTEYNAYQQAQYRCTNPECADYPEYGGRGIEFRFTSFEEFLTHIGLKPSPELSLDRIDNDGHYEKGNVRWADRSTQQHNKRETRFYAGQPTKHFAAQATA